MSTKRVRQEAARIVASVVDLVDDGTLEADEAQRAHLLGSVAALQAADRAADGAE